MQGHPCRAAGSKWSDRRKSLCLLLESSHQFWAWRVPDVMDQKDRTNPYKQEILN